jgi:hypothetical protein
MMLELLATLAAGLFSGASIYINSTQLPSIVRFGFSASEHQSTRRARNAPAAH